MNTSQEIQDTMLKSLAEKIFASTRKLKQFPLLGRILPEYGLHSLREIIFQNYRIVYRIREDTIEVVTICHGSMDIKRKIGIMP